MYSSQQQSRLFNGFKFWKDTGKRVRGDDNRRRGGQKYLVVFQYGHVFLFLCCCKTFLILSHHKCYMQETTSSCLVWTSLRYQKQQFNRDQREHMSTALTALAKMADVVHATMTPKH